MNRLGSGGETLELSDGSAPLSVEEVDREANGEPDEEADPGFEGQAQHQDKAKEDGENREEGDPGDAEAAGAVRLGAAEDDDPGAR